MRDRSLVAFTLLAQVAVGLLWALLAVAGLAGPAVAPALPGPLLATGGLTAAAVLAALLHLGTPRNAWRALGNLRGSWLSREILFLLAFAAGWALLATLWRPDPLRPTAPLVAGSAIAAWPPGRLVLALATAAAGAGLVYAMSRVYRLRTVPAWDTRLTSVSFFLTAGSLGTLALAAFLALGPAAPFVGPGGPLPVVQGLVLAGAALLIVELWIEPYWTTHHRRSAALVDRGLAPPDPALEVWRERRRALLVAALVLAATATLMAVATPPGSLAAPAMPGLIALAFAAAAAAAVAGRMAFFLSFARRGL